MKDEILKREMFSKPMSKSARNSGIMAGFEDEMEDDEGTQPLARSPQNPEILMNNLRGDMRSVDARYLELAQMVGEQAAMETPPEVLAMLQSQLAAQAAPPMPQGGIGSLPQGAEMAPPPMMGQGPAMPPGMEGMPPFPQGGADQAPPTPDGLPPLRAGTGSFVSSAARFAGEGIGHIGSALSPYVQRGITYLDELVAPLIRPGYRVEPLTQDGRRAVIQARENIVPGPRGPEMGAGTKLQAANTLNVGPVPFSQALRESNLGRFVANYPKSTLGGATLAGGSLYAFSGDNNPPPRSAQELKDVNALISQIPNQGPPLTDARGNRILPPGRENEPWEVGFTDSRFPPAPPERPEDATINRFRNMEEPRMDISPFPSVIKPPTEETTTTTTGPGKVDISNKTFIDKNLLEKGDIKDQVFKTRGERIKAEYESLAPTFKELLGDTKADARTNALLLLADAGFKFASTYKPTMAMALGEAMSGVPRGFAAIVAQAKDRDIKIKTAVLQQATENVNLQDKVARDFQLEDMRIKGRLANAIFTANSRKDLEDIKQRYAIQGKVMDRDFNLMIEQIKQGGFIEEDGGMGLTIVKKKNGSFEGAYIKPDANGQLPAVVKGAIDSRWTLRQTDNPFVDNLGPAPTTVETDRAERVKLGNTLRSIDNSLKTFDNLRGQYAELYSPGTWFVDKINNVIVPISGGLVRPDVNQAAAAQQLRSGLNQVQKSIASANDQGRVAVQEQEWAREILDGLNNPTGFFQNKELAAKAFATMEAQLRNARQNVLTQLGYISDDFTMKTPQTGTQVDPFVIPADKEGQTRMLRYLGSTIGTLQNPNAIVYVKMPNGRIDAFNPTQLRGLVQK